jgi:hypothetical protein
MIVNDILRLIALVPGDFAYLDAGEPGGAFIVLNKKILRPTLKNRRLAPCQTYYY